MPMGFNLFRRSIKRLSTKFHKGSKGTKLILTRFHHWWYWHPSTLLIAQIHVDDIQVEEVFNGCWIMKSVRVLMGRWFQPILGSLSTQRLFQVAMRCFQYWRTWVLQEILLCPKCWMKKMMTVGWFSFQIMKTGLVVLFLCLGLGNFCTQVCIFVGLLILGFNKWT